MLDCFLKDCPWNGSNILEESLSKESLFVLTLPYILHISPKPASIEVFHKLGPRSGPPSLWEEACFSGDMWDMSNVTTNTLSYERCCSGMEEHFHSLSEKSPAQVGLRSLCSSASELFASLAATCLSVLVDIDDTTDSGSTCAQSVTCPPKVAPFNKGEI